MGLLAINVFSVLIAAELITVKRL